MRKTTEINKMVSGSIDSLDERGIYCLCMALSRSVDRLSRNKTYKQIAFEMDVIASHIGDHKIT